MLKIKNVSAIIDTNEILSNINLEVKAGEVHAIVGPAKSGKSTLAHLIQGNPYVVQSTGTIHYKNKDVKKVPAHKRSHLGIFTTFQNPIEIDGFSNMELIKAMFESRTGKPFTQELESSYTSLIKAIGLSPKFPQEFVNTSMLETDEIRKGEIIQMLMLQPDLVVLDEIDFDVTDEGIEHIAAMVNSYLADHKAGLIVITANKKLLELLDPSHVHVMVAGEIRESGEKELLKRITTDGNPQFS